MVLCKVCGLLDFYLFILFVIEYLLILLVVGFMGMVLIELVLFLFKELLGVKEGDIYWEFFLYFVFVIGCFFVIFLFVIFYFNK